MTAAHVYVTCSHIYLQRSRFEMWSFEVAKTAGAFLNGHTRSLEDETANFEVI